MPGVRLMGRELVLDGQHGCAQAGLQFLDRPHGGVRRVVDQQQDSGCRAIAARQREQAVGDPFDLVLHWDGDEGRDVQEQLHGRNKRCRNPGGSLMPAAAGHSGARP